MPPRSIYYYFVYKYLRKYTSIYLFGSKKYNKIFYYFYRGAGKLKS